MRRIFSTISGLIVGNMAFLVTAFFAVLLYDALRGVLGISFAFILLCLGAWGGYKVFRMIQIVGLLEFFSAQRATGELDEPEATATSDHKHRSPREYEVLFRNSKQLCRGGALRIFGDRYGGLDGKAVEIAEVSYSEKDNKLDIEFRSGERLTVWNVGKIYEARSYLKIIAADMITVESVSPSPKVGVAIDKVFRVCYEKRGSKIHTSSDIDWMRLDLNVSLSAPALMIYG